MIWTSVKDFARLSICPVLMVTLDWFSLSMGSDVGLGSCFGCCLTGSDCFSRGLVTVSVLALISVSAAGLGFAVNFGGAVG